MQNHRVTIAELRSFGFIFAGMAALLFGLILPWLVGRGWPGWPWYLGGVVGLLALALPVALYPLYRIWMAFGAVMGWINTRILLGLLFFVILLPIGLIMKLVARDPMRRRLDPDLASYRVVRSAPARDHMEKPY